MKSCKTNPTCDSHRQSRAHIELPPEQQSCGTKPPSAFLSECTPAHWIGACRNTAVAANEEVSHVGASRIGSTDSTQFPIGRSGAKLADLLRDSRKLWKQS